MSIEYTQEEWDRLAEQYPPGTRVTGSVSKQQLYGVWVTLDDLPDVPALLEIIHFEIVEADRENRIEFPDDYPDIDSQIRARILGWCEKPKDVRLTQLSHLDWSHQRHLRKLEEGDV